MEVIFIQQVVFGPPCLLLAHQFNKCLKQNIVPQVVSIRMVSNLRHQQRCMLHTEIRPRPPPTWSVIPKLSLPPLLLPHTINGAVPARIPAPFPPLTQEMHHQHPSLFPARICYSKHGSKCWRSGMWLYEILVRMIHLPPPIAVL